MPNLMTFDRTQNCDTQRELCRQQVVQTGIEPQDHYLAECDDAWARCKEPSSVATPAAKVAFGLGALFTIGLGVLLGYVFVKEWRK
jgi:hypothetical protein